MRVLLSWSWRRIRHQVRFWRQFLRLILDWTVIVYIILPGIAFGIYEGRRYYGGTMLAHLSPSTPVLGPASISSLMSFALLVFVIVVYLTTFGKLMFPMQYGDRAFILLAPIRRSGLFLAVWVENTLGIYVLLTIITLLVFPLLPLAGIPMWMWMMRMALFGIYISSCRVIGSLVRHSETLKFKQWVVFN